MTSKTTAHTDTGYAQILEERTIDGTSMVKTDYVLGDDVISQSKSDWSWNGAAESRDLDTSYDSQYLLYDGHGSIRQLVSSNLSVQDNCSYDGYGVMLSSSGSGARAASNADTSLLYCGE